MQELSVMEDKFSTWEQVNKIEATKDKVNRRKTSVSNRLYSQQPKEDDEQQLILLKSQMDEIDRQIASNGGPNCGWDAADHKDFLRIRTKYQGKQVIAFNQEV